MTDNQHAKQRLNKRLEAAAALRDSGQFDAARAVLAGVSADPDRDALGPETSLGLPRRLQSAMLKLAKAEKNLIDRIGYQFHLVPPPDQLANYGRFTMADRRAITEANKQPVPRQIHQIWIGNAPAPITTGAWADHAQRHGFDYKLWQEADLDRLGIPDNPSFQAMMNEGDFPGAVDIARYEILERLGGIYLDCDWYPARSDISFDAHWPMSGLTVIAEDIPRNTGMGPLLLANSVIATPPNHPVFRRLNAVIGDVMRDMPRAPAWWSTGPLIFTVVCRGGSVSLSGADILAGSLPYGASIEDVRRVCEEVEANDGGLLLAWKPWA
ncbi:glycosyltransferase [Aliiroseovarius sp. YM-037]|uniref:glycosyltransferase n=1 Tax=Aliiroseovarius sp. YM-037 TaxID=3341728 RepID=UPI003A80E2F7